MLDRVKMLPYQVMHVHYKKKKKSWFYTLFFSTQSLTGLQLPSLPLPTTDAF